MLELLHGDVRVLCELLGAVLGEDVGPLLPATLVCLHATIARGTGDVGPALVGAAAPVSHSDGGALAQAIAQVRELALAAARAVAEELAEELGHNGGIHAMLARRLSAPAASWGHFLVLSDGSRSKSGQMPMARACSGCTSGGRLVTQGTLIAGIPGANHTRHFLFRCLRALYPSLV